MKTLVVNGVPYDFPEQGETPTWGEQTTAWATAVTDTLGGVVGQYDVLNQIFLLSNSSTAFFDINNFSLDPALVQGAIVDYSIRRLTATTGVAEAGTMYLSYNPFGAPNQKWEVAQTFAGDARCTFNVTDAGQAQIKVDDLLAGTGFSGRLRFTVRALEV